MNRVGYGMASLLVVLLLSACASGARVISAFGDVHDGEGKSRTRGPHEGVDVWGNVGDPVLASADGRVLFVEQEAAVNSCGKFVVIDHETAKTRYCHLSAQSVTEGAQVRRGDVIGRIGTTGWSRTPTMATGFEHVHWELRMDGIKVDPLGHTIGCFDAKRIYPVDRLVLTYPVRCKD